MHHEDFVQHDSGLVPCICELVQVIDVLRVRVRVLHVDDRHVHQGLLLQGLQVLLCKDYYFTNINLVHLCRHRLDSRNRLVGKDATG